MSIDVRPAREPDAVRRILQALPAWFGDPEAIDHYTDHAGQERYASLVAYDATDVVGVALIERHFDESAELHLIAVDPRCRRTGIGTVLIEHVISSVTTWGCRYLSVHTVGPSFDSEPYAQTRAFYRTLGFVPLEEHHDLDWPGPTVIAVRAL